MTLVILGFTEAASRKEEHRVFYTIAAALITLLIFAEVGWSARGSMSCGKDSHCIVDTQTGQLYFYLGWAVVDCVVAGGFILLLYKSLATMHKARWHVIALGARSLAILVLAAIGIAYKTRMTREAQVDVAMATSVCFLVVRAFRSLVSSVTATTNLYPTRHGDHSGHRTKRSVGRVSPGPSTSSQQHINAVEDRDGSEDVDGDIEMDTMYVRAGLKPAERSDDLRSWPRAR